MHPTCDTDGTIVPGLATWRGGDPKTLWLCATMTGIFASFLVLCLWAAVNRDVPYRSGDFFGLWSCAKIMLAHPAADLYDFAMVHAAQVDLGMDPGWSLPPTAHRLVPRLLCDPEDSLPDQVRSADYSLL